MPINLGSTPPSPLAIENVRPSVDGGRFPIKRVVGDMLVVTATVFRDGHGLIVPLLKYKEKNSDRPWHEVEMESVNPGLDLWQGRFELEQNGRYQYTIDAYTDVYRYWLKYSAKKFDDGQDIESDLLEGEQLVAETVERQGRDSYLAPTLGRIREADSQAARMSIFSERRMIFFSFSGCRCADAISTS